MTLLTVCIPAYNAEAPLERAIRSIRVEEVAGDVEILVCDDGSTDGTAALLDRLTVEIPQLRVLRNATNRGRPHTRNVLLQAARGDFLTWLDADDEKYPGMLRAQFEVFERRAEQGRAVDGVLVYTNYNWLPHDTSAPVLMEQTPPVDPLHDLLEASFSGYLWLMLGTRRTFLAAAPFDERLPRLQDLGFLIRFAELGGRFERVETRAALCAYHKSDVGRSPFEIWRSWRRIWKRYRYHYVSYGMSNALAWRRHHYRVARRYARANGARFAAALLYLGEAAIVVRRRLRHTVFAGRLAR